MITFSPFARIANCPDGQIRLTKLENEVFGKLAQAHGNIVPHESLIFAMYRDSEDEPENPNKTLMIIIHRLRRKLETAGVKNAVVTVHGEGYMLLEPTKIIKELWT